MPQNTEEVSKVLAYCNKEKIPVVAFGAGSSLEGHILPLFGVDIPEISLPFSLSFIIGTLTITAIASLVVSSKSKVAE
jgi:hypothetical protein